MLHSPASQPHSHTAHIHIHSLNNTDGFWAALNHNCGLRALRHGSVVFFLAKQNFHVFLPVKCYGPLIRHHLLIFSSNFLSLYVSQYSMWEAQKSHGPNYQLPPPCILSHFHHVHLQKKTYLVWLSSSRSNDSNGIGGFQIESRHRG